MITAKEIRTTCFTYTIKELFEYNVNPISNGNYQTRKQHLEHIIRSKALLPLLIKKYRYELFDTYCAFDIVKKGYGVITSCRFDLDTDYSHDVSIRDVSIDLIEQKLLVLEAAGNLNLETEINY